MGNPPTPERKGKAYLNGKPPPPTPERKGKTYLNGKSPNS